MREISVIFQLTTSRRGRHNRAVSVPVNSNFNSLPHAEVDHITSVTLLIHHYFNSLPHAEVDSSAWRWLYGQRIFQLTTSRRGRRDNRSAWMLLEHFNSLPHAEVDCDCGCQLACLIHFNSLPHAEVDPECGYTMPIFFISTHYLTQR